MPAPADLAAEAQPGRGPPLQRLQPQGRDGAGTSPEGMQEAGRQLALCCLREASWVRPPRIWATCGHWGRRTGVLAPAGASHLGPPRGSVSWTSSWGAPSERGRSRWGGALPPAAPVLRGKKTAGPGSVESEEEGQGPGSRVHGEEQEAPVGLRRSSWPKTEPGEGCQRPGGRGHAALEGLAPCLVVLPRGFLGPRPGAKADRAPSLGCNLPPGFWLDP
uniref:Uncharacterized protein n=1 Tax=Myotis myotis TaxID=51298 RepID=A0A7J7RH02_MYOMY|nr:hypothetical protein mMyoMyo1_010326 [Myotis myotis]